MYLLQEYPSAALREPSFLNYDLYIYIVTIFSERWRESDVSNSTFRCMLYLTRYPVH